MPAAVPAYDRYTLYELYEALNSIDVEAYPENYAALERELSTRETASRYELEECYHLLDRARWPAHAETIQARLESLAVPPVETPPHDPERYRYRTFWRRVGALLIDAVFLMLLVLPIFFLVPDVADAGTAAGLVFREAYNYLALTYFVVMHGKYGQTIGKQATGVIVMRLAEDRHIGYGQAVVRDSVPIAFTVLATVYLVVFGVDFETGVPTGTGAVLSDLMALVLTLWGFAEIMTMLFNRKRRAVHDFLARSVVIRTG